MKEPYSRGEVMQMSVDRKDGIDWATIDSDRLVAMIEILSEMVGTLDAIEDLFGGKISEKARNQMVWRIQHTLRHYR